MRFIFMSNKRLFTPDSGDTARSVVMFSLNNQALFIRNIYKEKFSVLEMFSVEFVCQ